jgi:class 3 adenylate cyclase
MAGQAWDEAYDLLSAADRDGKLGAGDFPLLAQAAYLAGRPEAAVHVWERIHGAAVDAGDRVGAAGAAVQIAYFLLEAGLLSPMRGWIGRAEQLLEGQPESAVNGRLAVARSYLGLFTGNIDGASVAAHEAIELGRQFDHADTMALGRTAQARVLLLQGHLTEALALFDELAVAATTGELDPITTGIVFCSAVCAWQGLTDYERAEEWTEAMERWRRHGALGGFHGRCRVHRAEILRLHGSCLEADREVRQACEEFRVYSKRLLGWPLTELGQIRLRLGDLSGAEEAFLEAHERGWDPQPGLALLRLAQGDVAGAAASIGDAVDSVPEVPSQERPPNTELFRAPLLAAQVDIALAAGDLNQANGAAEQLEAIAATFGTKALRASAAGARGTIRLAEGDATARERLEEAVRLWHELDAPYEAARARVSLGEAHRAAGHGERALLEFQAARSTFERLGAKVDAERAARLLAHAQVIRSKAPRREERVFMFTDIVKSTDLVGVIGDDAWGHLVRWHNETLARLVAEHRGEVVQTTGDGFFVTFAGPADAIGCAVAIQRALARHRREQGFSPSVRIGLHAAEATSEGLDWSGVGVHAAARIAGLAEGGEILSSRSTVASVGTDHSFSKPRMVSLKGISEPVEVLTIDWA